MRAGELKHKKQAIAKRTLILICIGLPVLAVAGFLLSGPIRRHKKTVADVTTIMQALSAYASEQGELPRGTFGVICQLLQGKSIEGQNPKHLDYITVEDQEVNSKGEILDPWGHPYRVIVEQGLHVYSCGPNGLDEHGKGDDIEAK